MGSWRDYVNTFEVGRAGELEGLRECMQGVSDRGGAVTSSLHSLPLLLRLIGARVATSTFFAKHGCKSR